MFPLVALWVMEIQTDPSCGGTITQDVLLGSSLGPDVIMALANSAGHSGQYVPNDSMALRFPYNPRCGPRSTTSTQPLMTTGDLDISTDPGCGRATTQARIILWPQVATAQALGTKKAT